MFRKLYQHRSGGVRIDSESVREPCLPSSGGRQFAYSGCLPLGARCSCAVTSRSLLKRQAFKGRADNRLQSRPAVKTSMGLNQLTGTAGLRLSSSGQNLGREYLSKRGTAALSAVQFWGQGHWAACSHECVWRWCPNIISVPRHGLTAGCQSGFSTRAPRKAFKDPILPTFEGLLPLRLKS